METKTENIAAVHVILRPCEGEKYNPTNLMLYHTSLALIEKLVQDGLLTHEDYQKSCAVLTRKYGFPPGSIFAETA
jgi:hypothetical protein